MYKLYHGAGTCSLAVKAALTLTDTPFETQVMDLANGEHFQDEYIVISPLSKVPALVIAQNSENYVLTEGAAILLYLSSQFPDAHLMPKSDTLAYAEALKWFQLLYATVHPHWSRLFFPERYSNDADRVRELSEAELHKVYSLIDAQLGKHNYIAGDRLSLADLYLMVTVHWQGALKTSLSSRYPNIEAYQARIYEEPTIGSLYKTEFGG
ncbi:glutathione S-transferase family protein [Vibrio sp. F74]|uniref:glutathione S-transferase family protein n=1 Tax=Vibrio sp. F74 TaxID=700020 RepID=UPI0035F5CC23